MENQKIVVPASVAKFGKTLLGGFNVDYPCPRCRQPLTTKNEAVLSGDHCPHCKTSFVFDAPIRQAVSQFLAEKQIAEQKKQVQEAEKQAAREAAREAKRQAAARQEAEAAEQRALEGARELEQEQESRRSQEAMRRVRARDVGDAVGCLNVILFVGGAAVAFSLLASVLLLVNANALNNGGAIGSNLFVVSVAGAVSLALTYVLFRILGAIHTTLVLILDRLDLESDRN